jgi:hypothetical protein
VPDREQFLIPDPFTNPIPAYPQYDISINFPPPINSPITPRLKVIRMSIRERSSVNKDRPIHQAASGNRHPACSGLDDLRMLEYQRHGESGDDEGAG